MKRRAWWFWGTALLMGAWLPLPVLLAILIAYTVAKPKLWLVGLAVMSELLTALPFGILTVTIFLPLIVRRWTAPQEPTVTFSFLAVVIGIALGQYLILASFDISQLVWQKGFLELPRYVPWRYITAELLASAFTAFALLNARGLFVPLVSKT